MTLGVAKVKHAFSIPVIELDPGSTNWLTSVRERVGKEEDIVNTETVV
jgi:hypothetical protein